jgi:hypothetical protein
VAGFGHYAPALPDATPLMINFTTSMAQEHEPKGSPNRCDRVLQQRRWQHPRHPAADGNFCETVIPSRHGAAEDTLVGRHPIHPLSLFFGLLIGAMWMGEVLFGNLGDTSVLGNVQTLHFHAYRLVVWSFVCGALVFTALSGFYTAYLTGNVLAALRVGIWSGLISGAITIAALIGMTAFFSMRCVKALPITPSLRGAATGAFLISFLWTPVSKKRGGAP